MSEGLSWLVSDSKAFIFLLCSLDCKFPLGICQSLTCLCTPPLYSMHNHINVFWLQVTETHSDWSKEKEELILRIRIPHRAQKHVCVLGANGYIQDLKCQVNFLSVIWASPCVCYILLVDSAIASFTSHKIKKYIWLSAPLVYMWLAYECKTFHFPLFPHSLSPS